MAEKTQKEMLDNLQGDAERLVNLLKAREIGLVSWWILLGDCMKRIHDLWQGPEKATIVEAEAHHEGP